MKWVSYAVTDAGKKRSVNEDSIYHDNEQKIWAVADGMGGHHRGDIASQVVVENLNDVSITKHTGVSLQRIIFSLRDSNTQLIKKAVSENTSVIASTCAILTSLNNSVICSWVGDSRIYRYRGGVLSKLTRDHSYESLIEDLRIEGQKVGDMGVNTQALTRGVGAESLLQVEHCHYSSQIGDRYLLCTDGLYKEVTEESLNTFYSSGLEDKILIKKLHHAYLDSGARDNLGLILVTFKDI